MFIYVVYITRLYFCVENTTDIQPFYKISFLESFICCVEGTCRMLSNGNCAARVPRYKTAVSDPRFVKTALYRNGVLWVPPYSSVDYT